MRLYDLVPSHTTYHTHHTHTFTCTYPHPPTHTTHTTHIHTHTPSIRVNQHTSHGRKVHVQVSSEVAIPSEPEPNVRRPMLSKITHTLRPGG